MFLAVKLELWQSLLLWVVAIGGYFGWRYFFKGTGSGKTRKRK